MATSDHCCCLLISLYELLVVKSLKDALELGMSGEECVAADDFCAGAQAPQTAGQQHYAQTPVVPLYNAV